MNLIQRYKFLRWNNCDLYAFNIFFETLELRLIFWYLHCLTVFNNFVSDFKKNYLIFAVFFLRPQLWNLITSYLQFTWLIKADQTRSFIAYAIYYALTFHNDNESFFIQIHTIIQIANYKIMCMLNTALGEHLKQKNIHQAGHDTKSKLVLPKGITSLIV